MLMRLGTLLHDSCILMKRSWGLLLAGAVILAVLYAMLVQSLSGAMEHNLSEMVMSFGLPQQRYEELEQRIDKADDTATLELMQAVNAVAEQYKSMTEEERSLYIQQQAQGVSDNLSSYFVTFGAIGILLMLCGAVISLVIYTEDHGHIIDIIRRCGSIFPSMVVVWLLVFIRSFSWIALIGLLPSLNEFMPVFILVSAIAALLFGPRLLFAPVLLAQEHLGATKAVQQSIKRSKGHWWRIVLSVLVVVALVTLVHSALGVGLNALGSYSKESALFLVGVIQQLTIAFVMAFLIQLLRVLPQKSTI